MTVNINDKDYTLTKVFKVIPKNISGKENTSYGSARGDNDNIYLVYAIPNEININEYDYIAIVDGDGNIIKPTAENNTNKEGAENGQISTVYKTVQFPDGSKLDAADLSAEYIIAFKIQGTKLPDKEFSIKMYKNEGEDGSE